MSMTCSPDTVDELKLIRDETVQLLKLGAFELNKWASNYPELLEIDNCASIRDNFADSCILGIQWNQCQDMFLCKLDIKAVISKRSYFSRSLNCSIFWAFWIQSL